MLAIIHYYQKHDRAAAGDDRRAGGRMDGAMMDNG